MSDLFRVKANPTFPATVDIPIIGGEPRPLVLEMRHRRKKDLAAFLESLRQINQDEAVRQIVAGWHNVDAAFDVDALDDLLQEHPHAAAEIVSAYVREVAEAKRKN